MSKKEEAAANEEILDDDQVTTDTEEDFDDEWDRLTSGDDTDDDPPVAAADDDDEDGDGDTGGLHTGDDTGAAAAADDDGAGAAKEPESLEEKFERLRSEHETLQHQFNSERGRTSGLQHALAQARATRPAPSNQQIKKAMASPAAWKQFEEDYPEMSKAINDRLGALRTEISESVKREVNAVIQPIAVSEASRRREKEAELLKSEHSDWEAICATAEFSDWVQRQPAAVKNLINSENAADASFLLTTYKNTTGKLSQGNEENAGEGKNEAAELRKKRVGQLKSGVSVQTQAKVDRTGDTQVSDDFDSAFAAAAKKKDKQLRASGRI